MKSSFFQLTLSLLQVLGPLVAFFALIASWLSQKSFADVVELAQKITLSLFGLSILSLSAVAFWYNMRIDSVRVFGLGGALSCIFGGVIVFLALGVIIIMWLVLFQF